jgi:hypothetical protein
LVGGEAHGAADVGIGFELDPWRTAGLVFVVLFIVALVLIWGSEG